MSQPPQPPSPWLWDKDSQQWFVYDGRTDSLIFQNGGRRPRPLHIPRTTFESLTAHAQGAATASASSHATNPINQDARYVATPANQQLPPQSPGAGPSNTTNRQPSDAIKGLNQKLANVNIQNPGAPQNTAASVHNPTPIQPKVFTQGTVKVLYVQDPTTQVNTRIQTEPVDKITDPVLLRNNIRATRLLLPTGEEIEETLFSTFKRREQPRKFFTIGKVFLVLWVEPAGESVVSALAAGTSPGRFGEKVFSKVRRFVVIREGEHYCTALPIATYGRRGVGKPGVTKSEHSIIHTSKVAPDPLPAERSSREEDRMRPRAIRVDPDDPAEALDDVSRLNYGQVSTIQHNIKVKSFGKVNPKSMNDFLRQFGNVWNSQPDPGQLAQAQALSEATRRDSRSKKRHGSHSAGESSQEQRETVATSSKVDGQDREQRGERQAPNDLEAAISHLKQQGYDSDQVIEAIKQGRKRQSIREETDDSDQADGSDNEGSQVSSTAESKRSGGRPGESGAKQTKDQAKNKSKVSSSSKEASQQRPAAKADIATTMSSGSRNPTTQPSGSTQASSRSAPSQSAPPPAQSTSSNQSMPQTEAQIQAIFVGLIQRGYSRERANEVIRSRFGSRKGSSGNKD